MRKVMVVVEMDNYDADGTYRPIVTDWWFEDAANVPLLRDPAGGHLNIHP